MEIKDLFKKDIKRNINGVIKVDQQDSAVIQQELEEYVVTKEMNRHFRTFFDSYLKSIDEPTDRIGVWISGFFGSGKSHFLKILSYLFANNEYEGKKTLDFFKGKFSNELLFSDIERAIRSANIKPILFNIDSKANSAQKQSKDAIVEVLLKAFNEYLGYSTEFPWIADVERELDLAGLYEDFKNKYKEVSGIAWLKERDNVIFNNEYFVSVLANVKGISESSVEQWLEKEGSDYQMSSDKFSKIVKKHIDSQNNMRIVFLIDEIGQYIGEDTKLMLNLQTVTEDLGRECMGKAWIIVTSQEAIDEVTKTELKGMDFSKIRGRFATQVSLSSENTDAVIKKRLLEKNEDSKKSLTQYFSTCEAGLKNTISFSAGTAQLTSYSGTNEFVDVYPFIPYQFTLLQKVFEMIRTTGATGAHLSEGERSMLSAFQEAGKAIASKELGSLVSFNLFYKSIETFLTSGVKRTINQAYDNRTIEKHDIEILKILFMIKYLEIIKPNLENITTLYVSKVDEDKIRLRDLVKESLERLESETLISQIGDEYNFLTNEEQDINKQIKHIQIDQDEVVKYYAKVIFSDLYDTDKIAYDKHRSFRFNKTVDGFSMSAGQHEMSLKVITPLSGDHNEDDPAKIAMQYGGDEKTALLMLPEDNELYVAVQDELRTIKFVKRSSSKQNSSTIQDIINKRRSEVDEQRGEIREHFLKNLINAKYYINGAEIDISGNTIVERINKTLKLLIESSYSKLDYVKRHYQKVDDIAEILQSDDIGQSTFTTNNTNQIALDEIINYLQRQNERHLKVTLKSIKGIFISSPFGWSEMDVNGLVAELLILKKINIKINQNELLPSNLQTSHHLTKSSDAEKIVVSIREQINEDIIAKVRSIIFDIFGKTDLSKDEDKLFEELKVIFNNQINELTKISGRYLSNKYPGENLINDLLEEVRDINETIGRKEYFKRISESESNLTESFNRIEPVKAFFTSQVSIFDEAKKSIINYEQDLSYLSDEARSKIELITKVLNNPIPYNEIKDLVVLTADIDKEHKEKLGKAKEDMRLVQDQKVLQLRDDFKVLSNDTLDRYLERFSRIFIQAENSTSLLTLEGLKANINSEYTKLISSLNDELNQLEGSDPKNNIIEPVSTSEIAKWDKSIQTSEDVDIYVNHIREELLKRIKEGKKIKIV